MRRRARQTNGYNLRQPDSTLSVVLCTYNRKQLVERAIASVQRQTFVHWELMIVDDGSTDGSDQLLLAIAKSDPRITYVRQTNRGLAYSRNIGVGMARGDYVTFIDSDDEWSPRHLELRVDYLRDHPSVDALHGGVSLKGPRTRQYVIDATRPGKKIHLSKCYIAGTLFIKRFVFLRLGGFPNMEYGDDYHFMTRLARRFKLVRVKWPTYIYHLDSDNRLCDLFEEGGVAAIRRYRSMG
jgi:glycosyltransferase involved in cell wall biosynthesis